MFEEYFRRKRLRSAARNYARTLPAQLQKNYGTSDFYTPAQIKVCSARAGLSAEYLMLGYATFLREEDFTAENLLAPLYKYEELRSIWRSYAPRRAVTAGFSPALGPSIQGEGQGPSL